MAKIKKIESKIILDCRANPTLETTVILNDGTVASACCPSGTSVGSYEAMEIKNTDGNLFNSTSLKRAIETIEKVIFPKIANFEVTKQQDIDKAMIELDGTQNKGRLGANVILSVSMATAKAAAKSSFLPLYLYLRQFINKEGLPLKIPTPVFNVIGGGMHTGLGNLDFQEFMIIPASFKPYSEALEMGVIIYQSLKKKLKKRNLSTLISDEGAFAPNLVTNRDALALLDEVINETIYKKGFDVFLGLDVSANHFYHEQHYSIKDRAIPFSSSDLIAYFEDLNKEFKLLYLEDPLFEDDWESWSKLATAISQDTMIIGDDLTVTNPYRLQLAIDKKAITGIVIKPNQIGTVIEAIAVVEVARAAGLKIIVSHRSGETNDDFIADFAMAVSADYVKFGAPARGERVAKYNRLLEIERQIKMI